MKLRLKTETLSIVDFQFQVCGGCISRYWCGVVFTAGKMVLRTTVVYTNRVLHGIFLLFRRLEYLCFDYSPFHCPLLTLYSSIHAYVQYILIYGYRRI